MMHLFYEKVFTANSKKSKFLHTSSIYHYDVDAGSPNCIILMHSVYVTGSIRDFFFIYLCSQRRIITIQYTELT
jgi:uncharacterized protein YjaZ